MVQIKTSAALIVLAAVVAPTLALPVGADAVELQEREPLGFGSAIKIARKIGHHHGVKKAAHHAAHGFRHGVHIAEAFQDQQRRELDGEDAELSARAFPHLHLHPAGGGFHSPLLGGFRGHGPVVHVPFHRHSAPSLEQPQRREFDDELDLATREPRGAGGHGGGHGGHGRYYRRDLAEDESELVAREPRGAGGHGGGGHGRHYSRELVEDESELVAREPRFGGRHIRNWAHKFPHFRHGHGAAAPAQDAPAPEARELADDKVDLMAREPRFGGRHVRNWAHKMAHFRHGHDAAAPAQDAPAPEARELPDDELELMARELSDDLD